MLRAAAPGLPRSAGSRARARSGERAPGWRRTRGPRPCRTARARRSTARRPRSARRRCSYGAVARRVRWVGTQPRRRWALQRRGLTDSMVIRIMHIRMTVFITTATALLTAGVVALGGALDGGEADRATQAALVIDASKARDGRQLVDPRLRDLDADVRLP